MTDGKIRDGVRSGEIGERVTWSRIWIWGVWNWTGPRMGSDVSVSSPHAELNIEFRWRFERVLGYGKWWLTVWVKVFVIDPYPLRQISPSFIYSLGQDLIRSSIKSEFHTLRSSRSKKRSRIKYEKQLTARSLNTACPTIILSLTNSFTLAVTSLGSGALSLASFFLSRKVGYLHQGLLVLYHLLFISPSVLWSMTRWEE
jgi:hypothetical protein